jgi:hypothetical protein
VSGLPANSSAALRTCAHRGGSGVEQEERVRYFSRFSLLRGVSRPHGGPRVDLARWGLGAVGLAQPGHAVPPGQPSRHLAFGS